MTMTLRRTAGVLAAVACLLMGLMRLLTLLNNADPAEGFLLQGPLLPHYLLLALPLVLIAGLSLLIPANAVHRQGGGSGIYAFCGLLFSSVVCICRFVLGDSTPWELAAAVLMAVGSLWFCGWVMRKEDPALFTGLLPLASWLVISLVLFATRTASIHHVTFVLELMGSLTMLLFLCGALRAVFAEGTPKVSRMLFRRGLTAFYFGFCLLLPQEIWQLRHGVAAFFMQGKGIAAGLLGITGLVCALQCMCREGDTPQEDPAAYFEEASRRLTVEDGAIQPADGRWGTAASALYGVPAKAAAAPAAPREVPAAPAFETAAAPAAEEIMESIPFGETAAQPKAPAETAAPTAAVTPIIQTGPIASVDPAPLPRPAATETAAPRAAAAAPISAPAQPTGTMDRLDDLLGRIGTAPERDTVDDLLADLDLLTAKDTAAKNETAAPDGEKWVFRR